MSAPSSPSYTPYRAKRASAQSLNPALVRPSFSPPSTRSATPTAGDGPPPAFPFSSVPAGASPFPPSTPTRVDSPGPAGAASTSAAVNGGRAGSPATAGPAAATRERETRMPYRSGFQPQGVRRDRTEEFALKRRGKSDGKKLEEGRLGRRMEKLVALHFPPPVEATPAPQPTAFSRLASISELRNKTAKDLWRSVAGNKADIERAEQGIVKWQEDSEATRCPICMASFGLKTRRHHCRLCGRVVCFLPPSPITDFLPPPASNSSTPPVPKPTRRERCSTFFTCEYQGVLVAGEKKPVGVIVEVEPVEVDNSLQGVVGEMNKGQAGAVVKEEKDERKKVRLCRDCLNVVLRQQEQSLPSVTPAWLKLYTVLVALEAEISQLLPAFQELVLTLQKPSPHTPSASQAHTLRKQLLTNLSSYETITKRIRQLPLAPSEGAYPGGSQDRLQRAIGQRGMLFLQEKLAVLRGLGDVENLEGRGKKGKSKVGTGEPPVVSLKELLGDEKGVEVELDEKEAKLAVLLEQEALVSSYVEDANAKRQFEDAVSLKASLDELREEIRRVRLG